MPKCCQDFGRKSELRYQMTQPSSNAGKQDWRSGLPSRRRLPHVDLARHRGRDYGRAELLEAVDGFPDFGDQRIDLRRFSVEEFRDTSLLSQARNCRRNHAYD